MRDLFVFRKIIKFLIQDDIGKSAIEAFEICYLENIESGNKFKAYFKYLFQNISFLLFYFNYAIIWRLNMFGNYIKITIRNIKKQKIFSILNIAGLAIGIAAFLMIFLYIQHEMSFDRFYKNSNRIYRLGCEVTRGGSTRNWGWTDVIAGKKMAEIYDEIEHCTRLMTEVGDETQVVFEDKKFLEYRVMYADANFFEVFQMQFITGDPKTVLSSPNTVVITESTARKYFGNGDPVGKIISIRNSFSHSEQYNTRENYTVTAVIKDIPANSHFHFDLLQSIKGSRFENHDRNGWWQIFNYFLLKEGQRHESIENKLVDFIKNSYTYSPHVQLKFLLTPITDVHLKSIAEHETEPQGNITYIKMFSIIAFFILVIACINFMNLSTAKSCLRAKEIGVRKSVGSSRSQLVFQFLMESILFSFFAFIIGVILVKIFLPLVNSVTGSSFGLEYFYNLPAIVGLILFILVIGILSGSYPALFLSSFKPVLALKENFSRKVKGVTIRNILIAFQFAVSISVIAGTLIIKDQIDFILKKDLGFKKENVIVLSNCSELGNKTGVFKKELKNSPDIVSTASTGSYPVNYIHVGNIRVKGAPTTENVSIFNSSGDCDFIEAMGMEIVKGRNFLREMSSDTSSVLLNQSAVKAFGLSEPVGAQLEAFGRTLNIVGVIKDFNYRTLHYKVSPFVLFPSRNGIGRNFVIRFSSDNLEKTLSYISTAWKKFSNNAPFHYSFLDRNIEERYRTEKRTADVSAIFSTLTILIGCLGLFGLANYTSEQRTKEIGIRKVMGATFINVYSLLTKQFIKIVIAAFIIAAPVSYFLMLKWMENFVYKAGISITAFIITGLLTLIITLVTVSSQLIKLANKNPVDSIKYE